MHANCEHDSNVGQEQPALHVHKYTKDNHNICIFTINQLNFSKTFKISIKSFSQTKHIVNFHYFVTN